MNILCIYVDGGKGHYIPAKAVEEQLTAMGHNAVLIDFFDFLGIRFIGRINKYVWRKLLEHSDYEMKFSKRNDQNTNEIRIVSRILRATRMRRFRNMIEKYSPDMIFTTHPYPGFFLAELAYYSDSKVPVTYYATDVFSVPMSAVCNHLYSMYVSTQEGFDSALERGQNPQTLFLSPFPLQSSCKNSRKMSKKEARHLLNLEENTFTLQINFGGEGVGASDLLRAMGEIKSRIQVIIIGGIVTNVNDYLNACDIIAGRSGINTLVEAFYLRRPFLITELVYTVVASADYVEKYKVGWNASHDVQKQIEIIRQYADNPALLDDIDKNFDNIPIVYDAAALARQIVKDCEDYRAGISRE